VIFVCVFLFHY